MDKKQPDEFAANRAEAPRGSGPRPAPPPDQSFTKKPRRPERVKMRLVDNLVIEGILHIRENFRLSDAMNDPHISFLPLTEVKVSDHYGRTLEEAGFISVNRSQIKYICCHEDINFKGDEQSQP